MLFSVWPSIHSHTQCTQSTNFLTFIHTLIYIHNVHTKQMLRILEIYNTLRFDFFFRYNSMFIQFYVHTILCSYIYTMSVYLVIFPFGCFFYSFDNLTLHYETNCMHTLNIRMSHVYVFVISNKLFGN